MLKSNEKLIKARVQLQRSNPFWAYLSLFLKFHEVKIKDMPKWKEGGLGAGVDSNGNFYYTSDFIDGLEDREVEGVIAHEICHIFLLHILRTGDRIPEICNICQDIVVNQLLKDNNFNLPKGVLWTDNENKIKIFNQTIKDCNKKTAEEIYDELKIRKVTIKVAGLGNGKGKKGKEEEGFGEGNTGRFDEHIKTKGKDGKELSDKERKEIEKEWIGRVQEAVVIAKMKGDVPVGMERLVNKLHEEKIGWKQLLNRFITNEIPYTQDWCRPSKKSMATGNYFPDFVKEKIDISIMLDLSGSIGDVELSDFMSEVIGIARAYQERISIRVFSFDTECYDCGIVENGNIEQLKKLQIKGGGGTSFSIPLKYLKDNRITPKCLIIFTDGYGDTIKEKPDFPILWVLSKGGSDELLKDIGEIIKLD